MKEVKKLRLKKIKEEIIPQARHLDNIFLFLKVFVKHKMKFEYPKRDIRKKKFIAVRIDEETHKSLEIITAKGIEVSAWVRSLINEGLKSFRGKNGN